jgi:3-hydroxyisobutyrate dehydrogenase-like beta-hydroxyacid dehydrogenase
MNSFTNENTQLGFIGIGNMGSRMAKRLLEHGYRVIVYNRTREAAEALTKYGAKVADNIAELASETDVILSSLTNDDAVKSVYTDSQGVFANVRNGSAVIDLSTVSPATSRKLYDLGHKAGVKCLDSPVSGSTPAAEDGTLALFCGGDEELFQAAQPIFNSIARQNFYLGGSGSGTAMKLVANTLLGIGMQAIAEAVALGEAERIDRARLLEVLAETAVIAPAHRGKLARAAQGDYSQQFGVSMMNKDFRLILEVANSSKLTLPVTAAAFQVNSAALKEDPDADFSSVIRQMEQVVEQHVSK